MANYTKIAELSADLAEELIEADIRRREPKHRRLIERLQKDLEGRRKDDGTMPTGIVGP